MRIIMYPSPSRRIYNPIIHVLGEGLRAAGVSILPIGAGGFWFPRALHVHWLEHVYWGPIARHLPVLGYLRALHLIHVARGVQRRGGRVVWTMHNLRPHEALTGVRGKIYSLMVARFLPLVSDIIVMSENTRREVATNYPEAAGAKVHVIPHPHFSNFYAEHGLDLSRAPARTDVPTFALVGLLRPYKGIVEVVEALRTYRETPFRMIIAGEGPQSYQSRIVEAIGGDTRFELIKGAVGHDEFAAILRNADAALFNFSSILNSGSVIAALSCGTPALCPADGALTELATQIGREWVRCFDRPLDVDWLFAQVDSLRRLDRTAPPLKQLEPSAIGLALKTVYGEAL